MVAHDCNSSTGETEAGGLENQGFLELQETLPLKAKQGAGEMTQLVKYLLSKYEDPSLIFIPCIKDRWDGVNVWYQCLEAEIGGSLQGDSELLLLKLLSQYSKSQEASIHFNEMHAIPTLRWPSKRLQAEAPLRKWVLGRRFPQRMHSALSDISTEDTPASAHCQREGSVTHLLSSHKERQECGKLGLTSKGIWLAATGDLDLKRDSTDFKACIWLGQLWPSGSIVKPSVD